MQSFIGDETPERAALKQAIIKRIMGQGGQLPANPTQGAVQGFNMVMNGLALRHHNKGPFPEMPGGGRPGIGQGLMNMFGRGGGLK